MGIESYYKSIKKMDKYEIEIFQSELEDLRKRYPESSEENLLLLSIYLQHFRDKELNRKKEMMIVSSSFALFIGYAVYLFL